MQRLFQTLRRFVQGLVLVMAASGMGLPPTTQARAPGAGLAQPRRVYAASVVVAQAPQCFERTKQVRRGEWRTLERFWNAKGTAFFKRPRGARIKVRYGKWLGKDRQKQTLDGSSYKKLSVGGWSVTYARMQMRVANDTEVTYVFCPGDIALNAPPIRF